MVNAMIMLMESTVIGERFVLNSENLSLREFFTKVADILGKPHPRIEMNGHIMKVIAWLDEMRGRLTKSTPLLTRENIRASMSKSNYSAEKFSSTFNYSFIPITESLTEALRILQNMKN